MLNLLIDDGGRGICVRDTQSIIPNPSSTARIVSLDAYTNTHLLPRLLTRPGDFIVTRYESATDFDLEIADPAVKPQAVIDREAELNANAG